MSTFIGIDLGTTFSAVAAIDETGRPRIVHNAEGANITPSCVVETESNRIEVGEFARREWSIRPRSAAARFKRDMGTSVAHDINGHQFSPTDLSSFVLKKLLQDTNKAIGPVGEAVVTIPANFAHEAREATMEAAKKAGLTVRHIINEPTAAALYYAYKSGNSLRGTYAVYDMGGGTFDISIIRVNGHDVDVVATNGVSRLGGDDFDSALQKLVRAKFQQLTGGSLEEDEFTKSDAEEEKRSLSARQQVTVRVGRKLIDITRDEFHEAISALVAQAEMLCEATIEEAGISARDIQDIFLVGGSTRMPIVQESVRRVFKREPVASVNVDEVVALGAALYAAYKGDRSKLSATQRSAIERINVSESTSKCFGTISITYDQERGKGKLVNSILIRKGQRIPCSVTESFYTVRDGQEAVNCDVTESTAEETDPRFVKVIWKGQLDLPPGRPANQEIQVTFAYDDNQIMNCSFLDVQTKQKTVIDLSMAANRDTSGTDIETFLVE